MDGFKHFLSEMPIALNKVGKWGEKDRPYGYGRPDIGIMNNVRGLEKIGRGWANRGGEKEGRFARIVTVPTFVEVVPVELLEMVAAKWKPKETPQPERPTAPPRERGPVFNLRAGGASGDMRAYARKALENESARVRMCPAGGSGGRNITLNDAAFRCGTMVGAGWITDAEIETELTIAAHVCGLMDDPNDGAKKTLDTIRRGIRDGREHPREQPPERNGTYTANGTAGTSEATADEPEKSPDPTPDEPEKSPDPTPDNCITITLDGEIIEENTPEYYTAPAIVMARFRLSTLLPIFGEPTNRLSPSHNNPGIAQRGSGHSRSTTFDSDSNS
jgi:hypothetical protein